ncbi:MAG: hypothetical protein ACFE95_11190 [Candidatus Hodarchaeota archaeon]
MISGSASNSDPSPLVSPDKIKTMHVLTIPRILPLEGLRQDVITIQWIAPFDSFNHNFNYSVYFSLDSGDSWILIASNQTETSYNWDTANVPQDSVVILKVIATCAGGFTTEAITDPYSLKPSINWANLIVVLLIITIIPIAIIGSLIYWKRGYIFKKPPVPIETFIPTMDRKEIAPQAPATPMIPVTIDSESLQDLLRGRAISRDVLTAEFNCSQLELPHRVKDVIGESMKGHLLVMRAGLFLIERCPPTKANCQICAREFEGENYFQCEHCQRYVCTPHYVDMKIVGSPDCPNCGGTLISLPFSCEGCSLDFSNVAELPGEATRCPLCGHSLVAQSDLIEKRTSTIVPSTQIKPSTEKFDEEKKR